MNRLMKELKKRFEEAVDRNRGDGILFSGGLDSALVASCSRNSRAVSIGLNPRSEDQFYAGAVARYLNLDHQYIDVSTNEALAAVPEVIRALRSFDPAVPNDVAVYLGLKYAKDMNIQTMMTGDGSDEIFAGYSFMMEIKELDQYLSRMHSSMQFNSNRIGRELGIAIKQPFLDNEFMKFGRDIDLQYKIRNEKGKIWGKWILRKAFDGVLPKEILWQSKRPLESGSGMSRLRDVITSIVSDLEFEEGKKVYPVRFWNKEHFYYYCIYREVVGNIPPPKDGQKRCVCCGGGMAPDAYHCRICGDVTEWRSAN
ncbi:MAG TPA: hypothetical protein ENO00_09980 [Deltaproteobacteria bacterium]|nr:hypothetical protein [Deltaproteobacteria bacterium]